MIKKNPTIILNKTHKYKHRYFTKKTKIKTTAIQKYLNRINKKKNSLNKWSTKYN